MKSILIICTGNSCRSQMAEGWLKAFSPDLEVFSAGTFPAARVSSKAIVVMKEAGIDIGGHTPKLVDRFIDMPFDYVVTVCDDANETCPVFSGRVGRRLHISFEDPTNAVGTEKEVLEAFRKTRDEIKNRFRVLYEEELGES